MNRLPQRRLAILIAVVLAAAGAAPLGLAVAGSSLTDSRITDRPHYQAPIVEGPARKISKDQVSEPRVLLTVSVTDKDTGAIVNPSVLEEGYFEIKDNGEKQKIAKFERGPGPVSVALLVDASGSIEDKRYQYVLGGLKGFFSKTDPEDDFYLVGFNLRPQLISDRTRDTKSLLEKLNSVEPKLNTAVFDAVYLGLNLLEEVPQRSKAIVLVSDGVDNSSKYNFAEVLQMAKESNVAIFTLCIASRGELDSVEAMQGLAFLDRLAKTTGGASLIATSEKEVSEAFELFAFELHSRIVIGYTPEGFQEDGKWHKVKVMVKPPKGLPRLRVRYREGYYATPRKTVR